MNKGRTVQKSLCRFHTNTNTNQCLLTNDKPHKRKGSWADLGDNLTWVLENKESKPGLQQVERWQPETGKLWRTVYPVSRRRNSGRVSAAMALAPAVRQYENGARCLLPESSWDMDGWQVDTTRSGSPSLPTSPGETSGYPFLKSPLSGPKSPQSHKKVPDKHLFKLSFFYGENILWLQ